MDSAEAFLLLSLPRAKLTASTFTSTDVLYLECVTIPPSKSPFPDRDVYLVLRISSYEIAIDPSRSISSTIQETAHVYIFHATDSEAQFEVVIPKPHKDYLVQDLETFDHILAQYAQFQPEETDKGEIFHDADKGTKETQLSLANDDNEYEDLRGRLVLINESDGGIIAELDDRLKIREDPALTQGLDENDPVILDLPPDYDSVIASGRPGGAQNQGYARDLTTREVFVHVIPPEERDALTATASLVSHAISATTTLLLSGVSYAADHYIKHSKSSSKVSSAAASSSSLSATPPYTGPPSRPVSPSPPVHRAVVITNPKTRFALTHAHSVSGKAVKVSGKTVGVVEHLIKKAVGAREKTEPKRPHPLAPRPRYGESGSPFAAQEDPSLSSRKGKSLQALYLPQSNTNIPLEGHENAQQGPPPLPLRPSLRKRDKIILSADLILGTMEESARRILDTGSDELTKVVGHKRGQEAGENAALATGAARNIALVYIDMRGIGRRAIIRKTGKEFIKARISNHTLPRLQDVSSPGQSQQQPTPQYPQAQYPGASSSFNDYGPYNSAPLHPGVLPRHPRSSPEPPPPPPRPSEKKN